MAGGTAKDFDLIFAAPASRSLWFITDTSYAMV
jgi:hypothetical protein